MDNLEFSISEPRWIGIGGMAGHQPLLVALSVFPLVYMRRKERPRRNMTIFLIDTLRLVCALFLAETVLIVLTSPTFRSSSHRVDKQVKSRIHDSRDFRGPPGMADAFRPRPTGKNIGYRFCVNNLMINMLEIFPGLFLTLVLNTFFLKVGHLIRIRLAGRRKELLGSDEINDGLGFMSGNYGFPIRKRWIMCQTGILGLALTISRVLILRFCDTNAQFVTGLEDRMFAWGKDMHKSLRLFIFGLIFPYLLISAQTLVLDRFIRHKTLRRVMGRWRDDEEYPMVELNLHAVKDEDEENQINVQTFSTNSNDDDDIYSDTASPRVNNSPGSQIAFLRMDSLGSNSDSASVHSTASMLSSSTGETSLGENSNLIPVNSIAGGGTSGGGIGRLGMRYGVITASLLNMAAVTATAAARPGMFGQASDGTWESESESIDSDQDDEELSGVLPSYDDSQRQHQELLRDTFRAAQQSVLITELKR